MSSLPKCPCLVNNLVYWVVVLTDFLDLSSALSGLSGLSFVTSKQLDIDRCFGRLRVLVSTEKT